MRPPRWRMQRAKRRFMLSRTFENKLPLKAISLNFSNAFIIRWRNCSTESTFSAYTSSLMHPKKKKSSGVRSGDLAGHLRGPNLPIHCAPNVSFSHCLAVVTECAGAPSNWYHIRWYWWTFRSFVYSDTVSFSRLRNLSPFKVPSMNTGPMMLSPWIAAQTFKENLYWWADSRYTRGFWFLGAQWCRLCWFHMPFLVNVLSSVQQIWERKSLSSSILLSNHWQ